MDIETSFQIDSLTQTYVHARKDGNIELALQIAFRLEDERRNKAQGPAATDHGSGRYAHAESRAGNN